MEGFAILKWPLHVLTVILVVLKNTNNAFGIRSILKTD